MPARTTTVEIKQITTPLEHSEAPHWDHRDGSLYFVDTFQAKVLRWDSKTDHLASHKLESASVGVVIPMKNAPNQFVVSADRRLYHFRWAGTENDTGTLTPLLEIEDHKPKNQSNDGKADSNGNLWLGTLTRRDDLGVTPLGGSLYRVRVALKKRTLYEEKQSRTSISNGIAWSSDDKYMFFIDSQERVVYKYDFVVGTGCVSNRVVLFNMASHQELKGIPDGMTIDTEDNLWVALFGGQSIIKVNSYTGKLLKILRMPVEYVTSVCFGGPEIDVLYATTSKLHLDVEGLAKQPSAGSVFAISGLGVKGFRANEVQLKENVL
ncbi:regucalcin-like [Cylas formicarius]|uniref:regucalcin-like n=1 Tax=Cylas formicarius TaxID=197179 RepID=UPI002958C3E3|nr:regucalcin-like [Cylas formicarius]